MSLSIVEANPNRAISGVSDKDDFFVHTSRKNIAELFSTKQVERCILMSTVVSIDADMGWYKLHLVVVDETRLTTKLLLFDNHAVQLLRQPCTELAGPMLNDMLEETNVIPEALNSIIGKTFLFKLSIEKENLQYKHDTYKVMKIISNKELIEEFEQIVSPKASEDTMVPYMSTQSDAPEANLKLPGSSSPSSVSLDQSTPAKRLPTMDKNTHTTDGGEIPQGDSGEFTQSTVNHIGRQGTYRAARFQRRRILIQTRLKKQMRGMGSAEDEERNIHSLQRDARANRRQILGNKRNFDDIPFSNTESADLLESSSTQILTRTSFCNGIVLTEVPISQVDVPVRINVAEKQPSLRNQEFFRGMILTDVPLREGYVPVHKGAKRQQVHQQTSNQVRMDVNTVAWSSTTRMKTGRIHSNIICSNTQHNVSNGQQTMNLSGEVVTQKEDLRQNNRETNSKSTIFNDITNVLGTSNRDGINQRPVQVGQKRKLSRRDSICVSPGVANANQNSRGTDLDCPVKKKSKGQEIMKPDTLLNVSKNNSVTISQPEKDPDFITWSSTLSSLRRHDTGLVIDCDPTQPLDKSFPPEVDGSCQTAPEVDTFTTVDESDEEDSGDEYWDCSSNDADDLNSDSDIDENVSLAQRQQRQLYINKVSECFSNSFGGNTQSNAITSVSGPPTRKEEVGTKRKAKLGRIW
ncbi:hypothetical protein F2Q69_00063955 [Brassica cretica]|uniref:Replication factor A C-terminal domain-containing protein n=1 Tax=Brassica cretica TaxID=69181 RepID=A0A8S9QQN6_BRACR|nr:hypothetical protein F2Q69_00063955 [Brassica cretica]